VAISGIAYDQSGAIVTDLRDARFCYTLVYSNAPGQGQTTCSALDLNENGALSVTVDLSGVLAFSGTNYSASSEVLIDPDSFNPILVTDTQTFAGSYRAGTPSLASLLAGFDATAAADQSTELSGELELEFHPAQ
jgi:hypothetical protein